MADLTITATSVVAGDNASIERGSAGETIAAGKAVYRSPTTKKFMLSDANSVTAAARKVDGIALNGAALNQPLAVQKDGDITIGAALTAGTAYYLSDTPGGICPFADIGSGEYVVLIGQAKSASLLAIDIQSTGVVI